MNDRNTAEKDSSESQTRRLQKLSGALQRVTLHVTEAEHESLLYHCGAGGIEALLESFVSDLANSGRRVWPQCHNEAHHWLKAHNDGEQVLETLQAETQSEETPD